MPQSVASSRLQREIHTKACVAVDIPAREYQATLLQIWKGRVPDANLKSEDFLLTFQLNAPVITKAKKCERTLLFIATQY